MLELHAGLVPVPHTITQIALIIGMYSLLFAWICVERNPVEPAMEQQSVQTHQRAKSAR